MIPFPALMAGRGLGPGTGWITFAGSASSPTGVTPTRDIHGAPGPGAAIANNGRRHGRLYFEIFTNGRGDAGATQFPKIAISQQIDPTNPYGFGASGFGCQYDPFNQVIRDDDTFGSATYGPSHIGAGTFVMQCAVDLDAALIWFGINNTFVGNPAAGTGGMAIIPTTYYPATAFSDNVPASPNSIGLLTASSLAQVIYTPPAGFSPWR